MQTIANESNQILTAPNAQITAAEHVGAEIAKWLRAYLANLLDRDTATIDGQITFERYGLDSSAAVGMTGDLADWLGYEVDAAAPYDFPTIDALSHALAADEKVRAAFQAVHAGKSSNGTDGRE